MPKKSAEVAETPKARKSAAAAKAAPAPTHDEIALRAYHIYLQRKGAPGNPFEDWKRAEQELVAAAGAAAKPRSRKTKVVPFAA